jgi:Flp pilus assembly protein TadD
VDAVRSEQLLRQLASALEKTSASIDLADVYDELGKALRRQGRAEEAVAYAQRAFEAGLKAKKGGA